MRTIVKSVRTHWFITQASRAHQVLRLSLSLTTEIWSLSWWSSHYHSYSTRHRTSYRVVVIKKTYLIHQSIRTLFRSVHHLLLVTSASQSPWSLRSLLYFWSACCAPRWSQRLFPPLPCPPKLNWCAHQCLNYTWPSLIVIRNANLSPVILNQRNISKRTWKSSTYVGIWLSLLLYHESALF